MRIHRHWTGLPSEAWGASVAMGNFDGVHLGHRAVLDEARTGAAGHPLGVITFEPHPREFFAARSGRPAEPFRLMNAEARANRLRRLGVDWLFELPFTDLLAGLSPEGFAREVLAEGLRIRHVAVGGDFRFGKDRAGTAETLAELGQSLGFDVTVAALVGGADGRDYSSTAIREALSSGDPRAAERMLGHWHRIEGEVLHGEKRGRTLGYPTANMAMTGLHLPRFGVYAVLVDVNDGPHKGCWQGVASLGVRPMFGENLPNLETHLFDFQGDLYGRHLSVALVEFIRPETSFLCVNQLVIQMEQDAIEARRILAGH